MLNVPQMVSWLLDWCAKYVSKGMLAGYTTGAYNESTMGAFAHNTCGLNAPQTVREKNIS